jgi:3-dehydroquinate synthetase
MVDSSIGGKTGVNTAAGKNLIGAVHLPTLVIDDINTLKSLPAREFKQGFAEIIKHAVIADSTMFEELKGSEISQWRVSDETSEGLASLVRRNIRIKSQIVGTDELDRTGERALLNFGHTVGHGIEQAGDYSRFLHGEAVSLGMAVATHISTKRAGLRPADRNAIIDLLQRFDLPTQLPSEVSRQRIMEALKFDKKFEQGQIRFVLTPKIGGAYLSSEVTWDDIAEAVDAL